MSTIVSSDFYRIQEKLYLWLKTKDKVNWKQIHKACLDLLLTESDEIQNSLGNYPEYKLFMPLLRNGICDVLVDDKHIYFSFLTKPLNSDNVVNPLLLLNNFPSIENIVETFQKEDSLDLKYYCTFKEGYSYNIYNKPLLEIGIYKPENKVYSPTLIFDGKTCRTIPNYDISIDGINIARCFVRIKEEQVLFYYHKKKKELNTYYYSELPILITRALFLFDKQQLKDRDYYYPISIDTAYKNIDETAILELLRIFGDKSVEVLND